MKRTKRRPYTFLELNRTMHNVETEAAVSVPNGQTGLASSPQPNTLHNVEDESNVKSFSSHSQESKIETTIAPTTEAETETDTGNEPPGSQTKVQACQKCLYHKDSSGSGVFCTRTCKSWCLILLYYIIFYAALLGFSLLYYYTYQRTLLTNCIPGPYNVGKYSVIHNKQAIVILGYKSVTDKISTASEVNDKALTFLKDNYKQGSDHYYRSLASDDTDLFRPWDINPFLETAQSTITADKDTKPMFLVGMNKRMGFVPESDKLVLTCTTDPDQKLTYLTFDDVSALTTSTESGSYSSKYFPILSKAHYIPPVILQFPDASKLDKKITIECKLTDKEELATTKFTLNKK